jgi:hypothetical protein
MNEQLPGQLKEKKFSLATVIIINVLVAIVVSLTVSFASEKFTASSRLDKMDKKISVMEKNFDKIFGKIKIGE